MIGLLSKRAVRRRLVFLTIQALSVAALVLAVLNTPEAGMPWRLVLYLLLAVLIGYSWRKGRTLLSDAYLGIRVLVVAALAVDAVQHGVLTWWLIVLFALALGVVLTGYGFRVRLRRSSFAVNLPGAMVPRSARLRGGPFFGFSALLLAALLVVVPLAPLRAGTIPYGQLLGTIVTVLALAGAATLLVVVLLDQTQRSPQAVTASVRAGLEAYAPQAILYFSAPKGSQYQALMWLPYLDRLPDRYAIVVRERWALNALKSRTEVPIVHASTLPALENAMAPSVTTVFYVNNGMKNAHCVRLAHLTHVQLLHGDSDKPPSFSPVTGMYDLVFVAGQAGIDRYAQHGVLIHAEKFRIVGRPQVEDIQGVEARASDASERPVVLYAPTWKGQYADSSLSSLLAGPRIVAALIELGAAVIFRPHPYSRKDAESRRAIAEIENLLAASAATDGRRHRYGAEASMELSIVDCFNASDAMVTDVSSVAADYLFSGKPFAITDAGLHQRADRGISDITAEFPLIRAAYLIPAEGDMRPGLGEMLGADPQAPVREQLRTYYLGDIPRESYADTFVDTAHQVISAERRAQVIDEEVAQESARSDQVDVGEEAQDEDV